MRFCLLSHSCFFNICYCSCFFLLSIEMHKSSLSLAEFLALVTSHDSEFCHLIMCGLKSVSVSLFYWSSLDSIKDTFLCNRGNSNVYLLSPYHSYYSVLLSHLFSNMSNLNFLYDVFSTTLMCSWHSWSCWEMATSCGHRTSDKTVPFI